MHKLYISIALTLCLVLGPVFAAASQSVSAQNYEYNNYSYDRFGMNGSDHPSLCYKTGNVDILHSHSIEPF